MRIGVIGPPGAHKSQFARGIAKAFDLKVIDNYVQRLQRESDLALGPWSGYPEHFMVVGVRMAAEAKHKDDFVTVGTALDTLTYCAVHSDVLLQRTQEELQAKYAAAQAAMQGMSMIVAGAWDYHLAFHLPYSDEEYAKHKGKWEAVLDDAYPTVLESLGVPFVYS
jgi:hypothetical protein